MYTHILACMQTHISHTTLPLQNTHTMYMYMSTHTHTHSHTHTHTHTHGCITCIQCPYMYDQIYRGRCGEDTCTCTYPLQHTCTCTCVHVCTLYGHTLHYCHCHTLLCGRGGMWRVERGKMRGPVIV